MSTPVSAARLCRRDLLIFGGAALLAGALPAWSRRAGAATTELELTATPASLPLIDGSMTPLWSFNGTLPGPLIRARQGDQLRVTVSNALAEETTVHWHGVRLPIAMDGVPHLTQPPIAPGERFTYEFALKDAGTFWYHPHSRSYEQVGRGLYGALIIDEQEPLPVDRDLLLVLGDFKLDDQGRHVDDFGRPLDIAHAGRIGNTVLVNGQVLPTLTGRAGERLRVRLINVATARIFALRIAEHAPQVIAIDGRSVEPHVPEDGRVVLGPGMRVDLALDLTGAPAQSYAVIDDFYPDRTGTIATLGYDASPRREGPPLPALALPANDLPEPNLDGALRVPITFTGGMPAGGGHEAHMPTAAQASWALNGIVGKDHDSAPLAMLAPGQSCLIAMANASAWHHTMHLHGHAFRVLARNGTPTKFREWQDTVLMAPDERVDIAFVAESPGDWMFHCHMLEHQAGGMMGIVRIV